MSIKAITWSPPEQFVQGLMRRWVETFGTGVGKGLVLSAMTAVVGLKITFDLRNKHFTSESDLHC